MTTDHDSNAGRSFQQNQSPGFFDLDQPQSDSQQDSQFKPPNIDSLSIPTVSVAELNSSPLFSSTWVTLLCFLLALIAARLIVPQFVEEMRYAWHRGELRAEYESSGEGLRNVSLESISDAYEMVSDRVGPSVAHIDVMRVAAEPQSETLRRMNGSSATFPSDQGSGIVVSSDGYILTNQHVVEDCRTVRIALSDGRRVLGQVVGVDALTDLALLKVDVANLIPIDWGDSDSVRVGSPVWAMGSPFGLEHTVTFGIISGTHRAAKAGTRYQDFMQSDVAVNPGNSGGPLINSRGQLIGVNTAIVGDTYRGVSFSIPSNVAKQVFERLRENGRVQRGWLGVALGENEGESGQLIAGVVVKSLADRYSPAALAGILPGDLILAVDDRDVSDMGDLMRRIASTPIGQSVTLKITRQAESLDVSVMIAARPEL